ncbi:MULTISPECIES: UPF0223 family protein [Mammaliicoccus]|uniref:UPF0223 family protein n=1 Tax=Mammaliicoccus fleurettii TaxID=150056 RepID=A0ABS5ML59_9STAP|nr:MULTISPECIES: UPF0223 family protein [Mammaliicoccus]HCN60906.1 hypothetical protein [Staphylococcus sp.]MBL0846626.1 UPF0223 family protein [Mammaliicoccus fleurettii]MBO3062998.1 UPF0223 family protein [Mammaliicoccus fleurettii]MBS3671067.1 UPF0223 family protein [Mammaliicoccus fleurettii]MBS3696126.1 UPF0223 family protein [Mammaliicoccus fleurettii]
MEYSYPIDVDWTQEEMIQVIEFYNHIEDAYESSTNKEQFNQAYKNFKKIVPGKSDENNFYKEFKEVSGYDGYKAVKALKENNGQSTISVK